MWYKWFQWQWETKWENWGWNNPYMMNLKSDTEWIRITRTFLEIKR